MAQGDTFDPREEFNTATPGEGEPGQEEKAEKPEEAAAPETEPIDSAEEEEVEQGDGDPEQSADSDKKGKKPGYVNRINKLTKEKSDALAEAAYYKGLAEGKGLANKEPTGAETDDERVVPLKRPVQDDFETYEEYEMAVSKYEENLIDLKVQEALDKKKQAEELETLEATYEKRDAAYKERMQTGRDTIEGFEAVDEFAGYTEPMVEAAKDSEHPAEILHLIATDPELHARILNMSPLAQIMEIGKLDIKFGKDDPAQTTNKPEAPVSKAPEPIGKGIGNRGSFEGAKTTDASGDKLPIKEWVARERERQKKKRQSVFG